MNRRISGLAALIASVVALMGSTSAHALFIAVDDFNSPDMVVADQALGGATVVPSPGNVPYNRMVSHELTAGSNDLAGTGSIVKIGSTSFGPGSLEVANAIGRNSEAKVSWTLPSGVVPTTAASAGPAFFAFTVLRTDANPVSLELFVNSISLGTFVVPPKTTESMNFFALSAATQNALAASGGPLSLVANGDLGWDLALDNVGIQVPEPGTLALVGMGLLIAASSRRARQR